MMSWIKHTYRRGKNLFIETIRVTRAPDKRDIEDNSKIFFLISHQKHML